MSDYLYDAFEVCLSALSTGVDLESCLSLYPDLADELRPALLAAQQARRLERQDIPKAGMARSRAKMLSRAAEMRKARAPFFLPISFPRLALTTLALVLVLFLSLNGLVAASAKSLPGDTLYAVKRAAEDVSLKLAPSAEVRWKMSEDYQQRRTEEIRSLLALNLVRNIALEGVVEEIKDGQFVLDGVPVTIDDSTKVSGELQAGRLVKLEGVTQPGGWIDADTVQLRFYEYGGQLNSIQSGSWTVDDKSFEILANTHIDPALKIGDQVLVLVYSGDDGTQYAQAVLRIPESLSSRVESFEPFGVEISGTVEGISGDTLVVNGKSVKITDQTEILGDISIGSAIKVHAVIAADGSLTASKIEPAEQTLSGSDDQDSGDDSSDDDGDDQSDDSSSGDDIDDDSDGSGDDDSDDGGESGDDDGGSDSDDDDSGSDDDDSRDDESDSDDGDDDNDSGDDGSDDVDSQDDDDTDDDDDEDD